jgi:hypothetical protein
MTKITLSYVMYEHNHARLARLPMVVALAWVENSQPYMDGEFKETAHVFHRDGILVDTHNKVALCVDDGDGEPCNSLWIYKHDDAWWLTQPR